MQELEAIPFMSAVTQLRSFIVNIQNIEDRTPIVGLDDKTGILAPHMASLLAALGKVHARSALASATRLDARIRNSHSAITYEAVLAALLDIESRFADHLCDIKLMVLNAQEASLFDPADKLLGVAGVPIEGFSRAFPNASFEIEEAAKCFALDRFTACVFHCMRCLEQGIRALCGVLEIPDATKPAERNWGIMLDAIRKRIDEKWPKNTRLPNTKGAQLEVLYATLDAIKNPWRNATMHVETIYAPHEALHIARCVGIFMIELLKHCDEEGMSKARSPANVTVGEAEPVVLNGMADKHLSETKPAADPSRAAAPSV